MTSAAFLPICNACLTEIEGGTQGFLLSCGHFICRGCCRGDQPSVCPHCGGHGRAAVLDHPPAEVRDYLQHPSAQFRTVTDVVKFQLDHFRAAAKQAGKALHEIRLLYSREVKRREEAEKETQAWRQRAQTAEDKNAQSRGGGGDNFLRGGASPSTACLRPGRATYGVGGGDDGVAFPIGKLRQRFFGSREEQRTPAATSSTGALPTGVLSLTDRPALGRENAPTQDRRVAAGGGAAASLGDRRVAGGGTAAPPSGFSRSSVSSERGQSQPRPVSARGQRPQSAAAGKAPPGRATAVTSGAPDTGERPKMSFSGPSPARSIARGEGRKPDTPRVGSGQVASGQGQPLNAAPSQQLRGASGEQRPRQWAVETPQRSVETPQVLGTPGRPVRPAWQDGHSPRGGAGGRVQLAWRPQTPQSGQAPSSLPHQLEQQQQQQHRKRPERSSMEGVRRPTAAAAQGITGGGGSDMDHQYSAAATSPRNLRGDPSGSSIPSTPGGSGHPNRSPPSSLLASRGVLKRPSSGGFPPAKRPGSVSGTDRTGTGNHQARPGTPMTPLRSSSPTARLRSPQLPFSARSTTTRPGSGQPSWSRSSSPGVGRAGNNSRGAPSTPTSGRQAASLPLSLEAAGLFGRR